MALESCCLREAERRGNQSGPERGLLSQGGEAASPGPRFPEQKPPGSGATDPRRPAAVLLPSPRAPLPPRFPAGPWL